MFAREVDCGALTLRGTDPRAATGPFEDLARLDSAARGALAALGDAGARCTLSGGRFVATCHRADRVDVVQREAERLCDALGRAPADARQRIDALVGAADPADRRWIAACAVRTKDASRHDVLDRLRADPDPEVAWTVLGELGQPADWVAVAADRGLPLPKRISAVHRFMGRPIGERNRAAEQLARYPELHAELVPLIRWPAEEEVEPAWIALAATAETARLQELVVERLSEVGTLRSLPALRGLRQRVGPLRFGLRDQISRVIAQIVEAHGAEAGRVALAAPPVAEGALAAPSPAPPRDPEG